MNESKIATPASSIVGHRSVLAIPSSNPSVGNTLEVVSINRQGYLLRLTDPMGTLVWEHFLTGEEPLDPNFLSYGGL